VSGEVREANQAYREARANAPMRIQQAGDITALVAHANQMMRALRIAAGLLGAPLFVLFLFGLGHVPSWDDEAARPNAALAPGLIAPFVVLLASSAAVAVRLARRRRAVESLLWARPLADHPEQLGCRTCGASLGVTPAQRATVTCTYCRTESIVGPEIAKRAAKLASVNYTAHANRVFTTEGGYGWVALAPLVLPLLTLAIGIPASRSLQKKLLAKRKPYDASIAYVVERCPSEKRGLLVTTRSRAPRPTCDDSSEHRGTSPFAPSTLRGERLYACDVVWTTTATVSNAELQVVDLVSDGFGRNIAVIDAGFGIRGTCLLDGATVDVR
jgi:hypothetical protein